MNSEAHNVKDDRARLEALMGAVRLRVAEWVWIEEGLRGLAVALGGALLLAALSRRVEVPWGAFGAPFALGLWCAVRGALLRRMDRSEAALLLDRVCGAEGEVMTALETGDAWLARRAVGRASAWRLPLVPNRVPRTLWTVLAFVSLLAGTPLIPAGQAVARPKAREAQAERIEVAAEFAATDPLLAERLRVLAHDVRGGEAGRLESALDELEARASAARTRAEAADAVARAVKRASGGAAEGSGGRIEAAARRAVTSPEAAQALREGIDSAKAKFPPKACPAELAEASRALDAHDEKGVSFALARFLDPTSRLSSDAAARLRARLDTIRAELGGAAAAASSRGGASSAGAGTANLRSAPAAVPSTPMDLAAERAREEALNKPTWPSQFDPLVKAYFGGSAEVRR